AALLLAAPLLLGISLLILTRERGPVFYSQTRVGQGGRPFTLHKFRTMRGDAEAHGTIWAQPDDPRATTLGRWLRRSRLDELPQLWNILKGDMSIVGPRPERPEFVEPLSTLIPFYAERHLIKPGLTGWAQINYRYGSTVADARSKLQLDLYYVKHTSLELDLIILLRTFGTFFLGSR
ncbi:sugar transferase, partial [Candidatus Bipolaricaulota bacterium]|nr:sugar transferase [Candidatus Bipolaricaulota bacterium]